MKYTDKYKFYQRRISIYKDTKEEYEEEKEYITSDYEFKQIEEKEKILQRELNIVVQDYAQLLFEELSQLNPEVIEKGSGKTHTFQGIFGTSFSKLTLQKMQSLIDIFEGNSFLEFKY